MRQRAGPDEVDLVRDLYCPKAYRLSLRQPAFLGEQRAFGKIHEDEVDEIIGAGSGPRLI